MLRCKGHGISSPMNVQEDDIVEHVRACAPLNVGPVQESLLPYHQTPDKVHALAIYDLDTEIFLPAFQPCWGFLRFLGRICDPFLGWTVDWAFRFRWNPSARKTRRDCGEHQLTEFTTSTYLACSGSE